MKHGGKKARKLTGAANAGAAKRIARRQKLGNTVPAVSRYAAKKRPAG